MVTYKIQKGNFDFDDFRLVRETVFVKEQGYDREFDEIDEIAFHIGLYENSNVVAVARAFLEDGVYHLGRIAVLKEHRKKGYGKLLVENLEDFLRSRGYKGSFILSAQEDKVPFYEKLGYKAVGTLYLDEGNPHAKMIK